MSGKSDVQFQGRCGCMTVLFFIFLVLKLCGVIAWSWWWVTAPIWGSVAAVFAFVLVFTIVKVIAEAHE